jgi:hypothetical protein
VRRKAANSTADSADGTGGARVYCSALVARALGRMAPWRVEPWRARSRATRAWLQRTPVSAQGARLIRARPRREWGTGRTRMEGV